ncbi:trifunctional purine biosynthetic protein adenosine-3 [Neocloeon triangulifer]|uniref:trifunctional purine biosynthetic protein adenosine-3 n=1 Tax=Neocloeon triangulifer TaxID=2078957 RepID=UPI00286F16EC|nr:trifunctional purine biosynthetic protein adenosine-3 [Neocloeon triangulifer]XP_059475742.1 trifunctional purine biosynthetic protein adenosine-3 [Neocloeon triangulifer]
MTSKVLVVGGGGREHALCWKLGSSPKVETIFVAPGNVGISKEQKVVVADVKVNDFKAVAAFCKQNCVELVVVGPEDPLASGIADELAKEGILCFGPSKAAAKIEANKDWAKSFMDRHKIPTARWESFTEPGKAKDFIKNSPFPALVVKASGLAAGKGVVVAADAQEACKAVDSILTKREFGVAGDVVVVEELLIGEEVSVLAFTDGTNVRLMLPAQDHKRLMAEDRGPNTGGMGAYCPCPFITDEELKLVEEEVLKRAVAGLKSEGTPFVGVLYAGLMMTNNGPKVLEFNCRFGDPETQVILPLMDFDLFDVMKACCTGKLLETELKWKSHLNAVGVIMASRGYPITSSKGQVISGLDEVAKRADTLVFHSGTALSGSDLVTNGGRVLIVVSIAPCLPSAAASATEGARGIVFDGAQFRPDIGHKGVIRAILMKGALTYKASGVDIEAGDSFVSNIKPMVELTKRAGTLGSIGGFGGLFDTSAAGYEDPILVSGTDGVGTKLMIAHEIGIHHTLGMDLVAMCVNDILAHAAEPLFFLDYFATGKLEVGVASSVVKGIAEGCKQAGCSLIGGETAEMPGIYGPNTYDLAGFAVGAVERKTQLPKIASIKEGDIILALPSSGLHSNGFSLVRKVMEKVRKCYSNLAPFSLNGKTFGEEFLTPTKIYVKHVLPVLKSGKVKAFAHITGGGLLENIPRVLPKELAVELNASKWTIPPVFPWLAAAGQVNKLEMLRTFNCGVGGVLVVSPSDKSAVLEALKKEDCVEIGHVKSKGPDGAQVLVNNFVEEMEKLMRPFLPTLLRSGLCPLKKRVGVLISGSGTNLQALLDHTNDPTKNSAAEIVIVISNKVDAKGLDRARKYNIPTKVISHGDFSSRLEFDRQLDKELRDAGVDIVCLAGFMRVLTGEFVRKWRGALINIHPALLPLFKGTHAHRQALAAGVRVTGCSVHFVEEEIDAGAIIIQEAVPIMLDDTEETLQERVLKKEHDAYPKALEMLARNEIQLNDHGRITWNSNCKLFP